MKRGLPRSNNDEKDRQALAPSSSNPDLNYLANAGDSNRPIEGPGITQILRTNAVHAAGTLEGESSDYGMTAVLPIASHGSSREVPRGDVRIQIMNYGIASLPYGERHRLTQGDLVLPGNVSGNSETGHDLNARSASHATKMQDSTVPQSDQVDVDQNLPFPVKLHIILSDPRYQEYVEWAPHGRAWKVINPRGLESTVIPKFFRSEKYSSFMRQVRLVSLIVFGLSMRAILVDAVMFIPIGPSF